MKVWHKFQEEHPYLLALIACFLWAVVGMFDGYISHNVITAPGPGQELVAATAYLTVGSWVGAAVNLFLTLRMGRSLDADYKRLSKGSRRFQTIVFVCGVLSAGATGLSLYLNQIYDPALLSVLGSGSIFYVIIVDVFVKKTVKLSRVWLPGTLLFFGALVAASQSIQLSVGALLLVFLVKNVLNMATSELDQDGSLVADAALYNLWRFFYLAVAGTTIAVVVNALRGDLGLYVHLVLDRLLSALLLVVMLMIVVFFANGFSSRAKKRISVSEVSIISSFQAAFTLILTLLANAVSPGVFGELPATEEGMLRKVLSVVIVTVGLILLNLFKREKPQALQLEPDGSAL